MNLKREFGTKKGSQHFHPRLTVDGCHKSLTQSGGQVHTPCIRVQELCISWVMRVCHQASNIIRTATTVFQSLPTVGEILLYTAFSCLSTHFELRT